MPIFPASLPIFPAPLRLALTSRTPAVRCSPATPGVVGGVVLVADELAGQLDGEVGPKAGRKPASKPAGSPQTAGARRTR